MDQTLRRKLDRITDILSAGGVTNPVTYIEQISYLIYLKLLDPGVHGGDGRSRSPETPSTILPAARPAS